MPYLIRTLEYVARSDSYSCDVAVQIIDCDIDELLFPTKRNVDTVLSITPAEISKVFTAIHFLLS